VIAIVIPTLNRSRYLRRALSFYARTDFDGVVYIADSSDDEEATNNKAVVDEYGGSLFISYHWVMAPHDGGAVAQVNEYLHDSVKYVAFSGDDDFHIGDGLKQCAEFLENNPDYVACHGHRVNFALHNNVPKLLGVRYGYNWDDSFSQLDRLQDYLRTGIALASYLHRKDAWIERYKPCMRIPTRYLGGELVQECTTALLGKVKYLAGVISFMFYQDNPDRVFSFDKTQLFDLINTPDWHVSYNNMLTRLVEFMEKPDIQVMKRELDHHIISVLAAQFQMRYGLPQQHKASQVDYDFGAIAPEISDLLGVIREILDESV